MALFFRHRFIIARTGIKQVLNKRFFERLGALFFNQFFRRITVEYFARMHHRHAITAERLIHKVGGNKDGDAIISRELNEKTPKVIPRHRVNAGGGFIQN